MRFGVRSAALAAGAALVFASSGAALADDTVDQTADETAIEQIEPSDESTSQEEASTEEVASDEVEESPAEDSLDEPAPKEEAPATEAESNEAAEPDVRQEEEAPPAVQPEPTPEEEVSDTTDEVAPEAESEDEPAPKEETPATEVTSDEETIDTADADELAPEVSEPTPAEEESDSDTSSTIDIPSEEYGYEVRYEIGDDPAIIFDWGTALDVTGWKFKITSLDSEGNLVVHYDEQVPLDQTEGRYPVSPGQYGYERYHQDAPQDTISRGIITLWVTPEAPSVNEEEQTIVIPGDMYFDYYLNDQEEPISADTYPVEPGDVTVTAKPRPGIPVRGDAVLEWTYTINEPADTEPTVIIPNEGMVKHIQNPGENDDQVNVLDEYKDMVEIDGEPRYDDGKVIVVLVPKENYTFPEGGKAEFDFIEHVEDDPASELTIIDPDNSWVKQKPKAGQGDDEFVIRDEFVGKVKIIAVDSDNAEPGKVNVVLMPDEGHAFPDGAESKTLKFTEFVNKPAEPNPGTNPGNGEDPGTDPDDSGGSDGDDTGNGGDDGSNSGGDGTDNGDNTGGSDDSDDGTNPGGDTDDDSANDDDDTDSSNGSDDSDSKGGSKDDTVKDKSSGSDLDKGEKQDKSSGSNRDSEKGKESANLNDKWGADTGVDETPVLAPVAGAALFSIAGIGIVTFLIRRRSQQ